MWSNSPWLHQKAVNNAHLKPGKKVGDAFRDGMKLIADRMLLALHKTL